MKLFKISIFNSLYSWLSPVARPTADTVTASLQQAATTDTTEFPIDTISIERVCIPYNSPGKTILN